MKVHSKDVIYSEGDHADEIFFISNGWVKLYIDINQGLGELNLNRNLVPFNLYVAGSYFGDVDVLVNESKNMRDGTAMAEVVTNLLVLNRKDLKQI